MRNIHKCHWLQKFIKYEKTTKTYPPPPPPPPQPPEKQKLVEFRKRYCKMPKNKNLL